LAAARRVQRTQAGRGMPTFHSWTVKGTTFWTPDNYQPLEAKPIGTGAYATVAAAQNKISGHKFALKRVTNVYQHDPTAAKRTLREILLLRSLAHPNIIEICDMWEHKDEIYIAEPLMEADLHRIVRSSQPLSDEHFQFFTWQILKGLKYMHSANVIHRDLKPGNILVNSDCDLKICDFGLARAVNCEEEDLEKTTYVVTRWYRAPELMIADDYTETVDIWAVGCILAEMLGRKSFFPGKNTLHQLELITATLGSLTDADLASFKSPDPKAVKQVRKMAKHARRPLASCFPGASQDAISLMESMLLYDPAKRPLASQALEHRWLRNQHDPANEPVAERTIDFAFERIKDLSTNDVKKLISEECCKASSHTGSRQFEPQRVPLPPIPGQQQQATDPMPSRDPGLTRQASNMVPQSPKSMDIAEDEYHNISRYNKAQENNVTEETAVPDPNNPVRTLDSDKVHNQAVAKPDAPNSCWHPCTIV